MLVVTRKKDEKLVIGNEIEIQVLRIGRENVRLGIKAPAHISIYRHEIFEAIRSQDGADVQSQIPPPQAPGPDSPRESATDAEPAETAPAD